MDIFLSTYMVSVSPVMPATYVRLGPKGYMVFKPYKKDAANIYNMPLRPTDVFVASYQRSGKQLHGII